MSQNNNYPVDSESDEEDEDENTTLASGHTNWHMQDIEKLKDQTNDLLDLSWKETRNKHLLYKMLELEQPNITVKMIDFLLQDGVCETLVGFITLNGIHSVRPSPSDSGLLQLKKSYRAVLLLSPDTPSEALNTLLSKKTAIITRKIFEIFRGDSGGSFYHIYRLLESLLRSHPSEVFAGMVSDGGLQERMGNVMHFIGFPPVSELLSMIISLSPITRTSALYTSCQKARWQFLQELINWGYMLHMCKVVCRPEATCCVDLFVNSDQHSSAAAQLLQELIEKISLEDSGELLLQALGDNSIIIDSLVDGIVKSAWTVKGFSSDSNCRRAAKVLCFLLRRAADAEILCYTHHPNNNNIPPTATYVANKLFTLRESIVTFIKARLPEVISFLAAFDLQTSYHDNKEGVKYSNYEVVRPFTSIRSQVIELLVLMVESDDSIASTVFTQECWVMLITWVLKYAHNNIFHALFYRLVFAVLRQQQEQAQKILFQKAKLISFLIENFVSPSLRQSKEVLSKCASPQERDLLTRRISCRGLIMNCSNAIRLQLNSQSHSHSSYLNNFLQEHPKWKDFVEELKARYDRVATEVQLHFGLGVGISASEADTRQIISNSERGGMSPVDIAAKISDWDKGAVQFARSLGFYEDNGDTVVPHAASNSSITTTTTIGSPSSLSNEARSEQRRHSFEEGYGSFSDFVDQSPDFVVDEIDQVTGSNSGKALRSHSLSPLLFKRL